MQHDMVLLYKQLSWSVM